jgi:hypothetical protein
VPRRTALARKKLGRPKQKAHPFARLAQSAKALVAAAGIAAHTEAEAFARRARVLAVTGQPGSDEGHGAASLSRQVLESGNLVSIGRSGRIVSGLDKGRLVMDISDVSLFGRGSDLAGCLTLPCLSGSRPISLDRNSEEGCTQHPGCVSSAGVL